MLIFEVLSYNPTTNNHRCRAVDGVAFPGHHSDEVEVDLMVDGGLGKIDPESLVGKRVEVEYVYPYSFIAQVVKAV